MPDGEAVLHDREGRLALRLERRLTHSPERVWRALVDPSEHVHWHQTPFELDPDPVPGRRVHFLASEHSLAMHDGELTDYDPPHVLAHTWGDDHLRWELAPQDRGCRLVLTHTFGEHRAAAERATRWHLCLDALAERLTGSRRHQLTDVRRNPGWSALERRYREAFGVEADAAD